MIGIQTGSAESALDVVKTAGRLHGHGTRSLLKSLLYKPTFRDWMQLNRSDSLVLRSINATGTSAMLSTVCAALISSLEGLEPAITLHYFCKNFGQEHEKGGLHLLRSLISQLLETWPADKPFTLDGDALSLPGDSQLWFLFKGALTSLPGATVFCIIDGPEYYGHEEELQSTIRGLLWLANTIPSQTNLKILITSPFSNQLMDLIPEDRHVFLNMSMHDKPDLGDDFASRELVRHHISQQ